MKRSALTFILFGQMVLAIIFIKINDKNLLKDVSCIVFYSFLSNDTLKCKEWIKVVEK